MEMIINKIFIKQFELYVVILNYKKHFLTITVKKCINT